MLCSTTDKIKGMCRHYDQLHAVLADRAQSQPGHFSDNFSSEERDVDSLVRAEPADQAVDGTGSAANTDSESDALVTAEDALSPAPSLASRSQAQPSRWSMSSTSPDADVNNRRHISLQSEEIRTGSRKRRSPEDQVLRGILDAAQKRQETKFAFKREMETKKLEYGLKTKKLELEMKVKEQEIGAQISNFQVKELEYKLKIKELEVALQASRGAPESEQ
jgi:hypothetical protein